MHLSQIKKWALQSPPAEWIIFRLRELLIGALRQGSIPQHIAFVMDGNRRFARSRKIETVEGHNLGFEALAKVRRSRFVSVREQTDVGKTDFGSVLQIWRPGCDGLRIQH